MIVILWLSVQVFGFVGDGLLRLQDYNAGVLIATLDGIVTDPYRGSIHVVDVTAFLRAGSPTGFVGFALRMDRQTTPGLLFFPAPQLIVDYPAVAADC